MARIKPKRGNPAAERAAHVNLLRQAIKEHGMVVIALPDYCKGRISDIWGRDYSSMRPLDVKLFQDMDALVDSGEFNRGPYGLEALAYYSKLGTRMYEQGRH